MDTRLLLSIIFAGIGLVSLFVITFLAFLSTLIFCKKKKRKSYWMRRGEELVSMTPDMLKRIFGEGDLISQDKFVLKRNLLI